MATPHAIFVPVFPAFPIQKSAFIGLSDVDYVSYSSEIMGCHKVEVMQEKNLVSYVAILLKLRRNLVSTYFRKKS